jgi:hypothetical protein
MRLAAAARTSRRPRKALGRPPATGAS